VRVYVGRDAEIKKRKYLNKTIHGGLRDAQAHLNKMLGERDRGRNLDSSKQALNQLPASLACGLRQGPIAREEPSRLRRPACAATLPVMLSARECYQHAVSAYSFTSKPISLALLAARKRGVDVRVVVDGVTAETGSFNFTASAGSKNAENVLVLHDPAVAERYQREWERLWGESEPVAPRY
jgi:phosphatidylserine/phosphatidylglycerophosphate/cardiolipin synthase-like enzyme